MNGVWTCTCCGSSAIAQDALVEANSGAVLSVYDAMACSGCGSTDIDRTGPERPVAPGAPARGGDLLDRVAAMAADHLWSGDIAERLTCEEAELLAEVLRHTGRADRADSFLAQHAAGDYEPEDAHHDLYTAPGGPAGTAPHPPAR